MPTENRSSNTDPRDVFIRLNPLGLGEAELRKDSTGFEDQRTHSDYLLFLAGYRETHPEPLQHPEPIAWMVGTAFWWTKEEAERDAAETGLPIVGLGPMTGISPDEQHQGEPVGTLLIEEYFDNREVGEVDVQLDSKVCEQLAEKYPGQSLPLYTHADPGEVERLHSKIETMRRKNNEYCEEVMSLRAQLAERDALLRDQSGKLIELAARLIQEPLRVLGGYLDNEGPITRNKATHGVEQAGDSLGGLALEVRRVADALSASAEPSAPVAPYPNRLCHIDYTAHPHRCGCLKGDEEAQRRYDEHFRAASTEPSAPASFQARVQPWLMECFGEMIAGDREERNHRFLEEALELVQALGATATEAHQLVDYVFGRQVGEPGQEVGGVMVTLAALCLANGLDMHQLAETELARIWTKVEQIRAKQASKPQFGPLPGVYPDRKQ